ncbi:MAG: spermine synthase [Deltaproteobacteria bacterium]|nr:MAG: spermine synthase [Deltaproteobacteria bacterium]
MLTKDQRNPEFASHLQAEIIASAISNYQCIEITRHSIFGCQLVIDGDLQISESDSIYGSAMVAPLLRHGATGRVAILGGGDGGVLWELIRSCERIGLPLEKAWQIDIDPEVLRLCRRYLPKLAGDVREHPRAEIVTGDAFAWIAGARDLDGVIYDLTMDPIRSGQSREAFMAETMAHIARALKPGGVFSMQCCGEGEGNADLARESGELLREIRAEAARHFTDIREQQVAVPSFLENWTFLSARKPER